MTQAGTIRANTVSSVQWDKGYCHLSFRLEPAMALTWSRWIYVITTWILRMKPTEMKRDNLDDANCTS